jgi:hypothetical protein
MVVDLLMDPGINVAFQQFSPALTSFFTQGEFLDSMPWYFLLISLITFGLHPRYGVRLAMLFGLNSGLNEAVKLACRLPRPYWVSAAVKGFSAHSSFERVIRIRVGSGHWQGITTLLTFFQEMHSSFILLWKNLSTGLAIPYHW